MEIDTPDIKALEFYSGIGGFHYALKGLESKEIVMINVPIPSYI